MLKNVLALGVCVALSGCVIHIDGSSGKRADHKITQTLSLEASELDKLVADVDAGNIEIIGVEGLESIELTANILTTKDKNYTLTLARSGKEAKLIAEKHPEIGLVWYSGNSPRIDLLVKVPARFNVQLVDDSGDIKISKVNGNIDINDDSGDIEVLGGHNVTINDDSGDIVVMNATGFVDIEDDSGDLSVLNVKGSVKINDGSGDIEINGAGGLEIVDAGSGDLSIKNVNGKVMVAD